MGLAEKRAVQSIKENEFKNFQSALNSICSFNVAVDIDWASIENDSEATFYSEKKKVSAYWFDRVNEALKSVCSDEMGKSALKEKLKNIVFINTSGDMDFSNGIFTIKSSLNGSGVWDAEQIQQFLEKHL